MPFQRLNGEIYQNHLLTAVILCGLIGSGAAQKKSTLLGHVVIGEVAGMDAPTRKITIKYPGKKGTEIFSGILAYSSKLKMKDGSVQEIIPGIRVRAFYKSDHETEGGQKKKINRVFRIEFLGRDEYVRLHNQLKVDPSTAVARAENDDLPSISPLKVYLAIAYSNVQQSLVDWTNKWKPCSASGQLRNETVHLWPGTYERVTFTSGSPSSSGGRVRARHHRSR